MGHENRWPYTASGHLVFIRGGLFFDLSTLLKEYYVLHLMNPKRTRNLKEYERIVGFALTLFLQSPILLNPLYVFGLVAVQKSMKTHNGMGNEWSGSSKKRNFFTITNTPRSPLCFWTWCRSKDHETQNGMRTNCLVHRRSVVFLAYINSPRNNL